MSSKFLVFTVSHIRNKANPKKNSSCKENGCPKYDKRGVVTYWDVPTLKEAKGLSMD